MMHAAQYSIIAITILAQVSYQTAKENLPAECLKSGKIGTSLGSFSISVALLNAFMAEFKTELEGKKGKLDTDPHVRLDSRRPCLAASPTLSHPRYLIPSVFLSDSQCLNLDESLCFSHFVAPDAHCC